MSLKLADKTFVCAFFVVFGILKTMKGKKGWKNFIF